MGRTWPKEEVTKRKIWILFWIQKFKNFQRSHFNVFLGFLLDISLKINLLLFIYLFGVLRHFQHCTGHITTGSWKGRGNQYIQFVRVLYCKLPTNGKQLPAFPLQAVTGIEPRPQRWEARVLPVYHHKNSFTCLVLFIVFLTILYCLATNYRRVPIIARQNSNRYNFTNIASKV